LDHGSAIGRIGLLGLALLVAGGYGWWMWQVDELEVVVPAPPGVLIDSHGTGRIVHAGRVFVTRVSSFRDELFAYLMFQHYKSTGPLAGEDLVLCYCSNGSEPRYSVLLVLTEDQLEAVGRVAALHAARRIEALDWMLLPKAALGSIRKQSQLFVSAYNLPVQRSMEELSKAELRELVRRFIRFKSTTDPRVRKRIEPTPKVLQTGEAQRLAGDILDVAEFYQLPLDYLLGIGAMENNYMHVRGDLKHSIWKRRPAKDDVVLERRGGRVRVLNDSAGVWQITRETLRHAHRLFLADKRDYSRLAPHLRPGKNLDVNEVAPDVLTTYAGILLRDLLDRFGGDVARAVGAYNGGPGNPNMRYSGGVQAAASHARQIVEQAAVLKGQPGLSLSWWTSRD
jgi:hypothetical protein